MTNIYFETAELRTQKKYWSDAGIDLRSKKTYEIKPKQIVKIDTGVTAEISEEYFGYVTGRSSMNVRGLLVANGTIDSEYRGEISVILINLSEKTQVIHIGERVAQMIIIPCILDFSTLLGKAPVNTQRATAGFGSTGRI